MATANQGGEKMKTKVVNVPGAEQPIEIWPNNRTGIKIKSWMLYWTTWALGSNGSFGVRKITEWKELLKEGFFFFGKVCNVRSSAKNKGCDYVVHHEVFLNYNDDLSFYGIIDDIEVARGSWVGNNSEQMMIIVTVHFTQLNNDCGILRRFMVVDKHGDPDGAMTTSWWELRGERYPKGIYFEAARFELD